MDFDFKTISPYEQRLKFFEDSETVSRIDKAKAYGETIDNTDNANYTDSSALLT